MRLLGRIDGYIFASVPKVLVFIARLLLLITLMICMLVLMGQGGRHELVLALGTVGFAWLHYLLAASIRTRHRATLPLSLLLSSISIGMSLNSPFVISSLGAGAPALYLTYGVTVADIVISFGMVIWSVYHFRSGTFDGAPEN